MFISYLINSFIVLVDFCFTWNPFREWGRKETQSETQYSM